MITIEGSNLRIFEMGEENIEVVDGNAIFKAKQFEFSCENEFEYGCRIKKNEKVILYNYTVEKLEEGYIEKKIIKKGIENIYENNDDMLYSDIDENVDVIYDYLKEGGCFR